MSQPIQCTEEDLQELKRLALAVRANSDDDDALGVALDEYDEHANPDQILCLFEAIDRVTAERDALQQRLTAADERADERADELERDKARIDWLAEQPVDTLYLDDGRIIDIAGRVDLRNAIDAAMAAPASADDDCQQDDADANEPPCSVCFARGCNGECIENL